MEKIVFVCDFGGIQEYIFDIAHIGTGGVARRLRARSLFVTVLLEAVKYELGAEILLSAGGKFYLGAPNTGDMRDKIESLKKRIERWLHDNLNADVTLHIACKVFDEETIKGNFVKVMFELSQELGKEKLSAFKTVLASDRKWDETAFILEPYDEGKYPCRSCRKLPAKGDEKEAPGRGLCEFCKDDADVGSSIPKAKYINILKGEKPERGWRLWDDLTVEVSEEPKGEHSIKIRDITVNRVPTIKNEKELKRCEEMYPEEGHKIGDVAPFDILAERNEGYKALAYLKADVDALGKAFAFRLKDNSETGVRDLSEALNRFFCGWVQKATEDEFPDIYTVFSGGDDLFLIGPWEEIIDFAFKMQSEFRKAEFHNMVKEEGKTKGLTISAGVVLSHPKSPIAHMAELAESVVEKAKDEGKDRITLFGETLKWDKAKKAVDKGKELAKRVGEGELSHAFLYNLLTYAQLYKEYYTSKRSGDKVKTEYLRWLPLMTNDIARNLKEESDVRIWAEELKNAMANEETEPAEVLVMTNYALLRTRRVES